MHLSEKLERRHLPYIFIVKQKVTDMPELNSIIQKTKLNYLRLPCYKGKPLSMLHLKMLELER